MIDWKSIKIRRKLIKTFKSGGIYLGTDERPIFPKINNIKTNGYRTQIVFNLPNGLDPKSVVKKEYVFLQHFGKNIELEGEYKKFTLKIYHQSMPSTLKYNFADIQKACTDLLLPAVCGMDRTGEYIALDMLKHPHILIAGETGSGKSTQLRSILTTLIKIKRPEELHFYMGDCKKSEFHIFRKVEHVQCVHSSVKDIKKMLQHIKKELDERSDLTEMFEVSHVDELPTEHKRPYLVVAIDEFVMLRKDGDIMDILTEIAAIGRTLGVFLILSMQRPSAKVLDTTIRANLTVSMGFKLRDVTESRIVNTPNAHTLETSGRFVMNADQLYELHAPYLTMDLAKKLLNPFIVAKCPVKEVKEEIPQLTEKDVFNDVN
ncbi:FtsK/SpoIIIE domain-containing protein [Cytobacillus praedii]|uniref:FtsK/SpoIIIE domain-containing protein n=1 Tax=Cytobacillus praedii TaxID=1742358 RepID=UPI002E1F8816|nr:FtsK/SpoIIIE domain-containing protein [Cytobacillus praedii]MED3549940.1 FtsK/SpoIIIE domain-containing protein [Cytobacillus praedii]